MMKTLPTLALSGTLYVASDIHLGSSIPKTNQLFYAFLQRASQEAEGLFLLGDIFNVWFGDDIALSSQEKWLKESLAALSQCAQKIPVYFIHGNRDFLMGKALCDALGVELLPEQVLVQTDAGLLFMSHGDELCTHDKGYTYLRNILRYAPLQRLFLALPFRWRHWIGQCIRKHSKASHTKKNAVYHERYDINQLEVKRIIEHYPDILAIIHGHTHKEAIHPIAHTPRKRFVLPDWDIDHNDHHGYLAISTQGLEYRKLTLTTPTATP